MRKCPVPPRFLILSALLCCVGSMTRAQTFNYALDLTDVTHHRVGVAVSVSGLAGDTVEFVMPSWSPGFYQFLNFADSVVDLHAKGDRGQELGWVRRGRHAWRVANGGARITLNYAVKVSGTRAFVGFSHLSADRGFIIPASTCMYATGKIGSPATIQLKMPSTWSRIATGLDSLPGRRDAFRAPDIDFLYDCPILCGNLVEFPAFQVNGIPHRFLAYNPGALDQAAFMEDLRKVVTAGYQIIGDIPYGRYTFIGIGPGGGGIEHLNSTAVSFSGDGLKTREGQVRVLHFLGHEYFHHYNVKRIRPIELGPFDYENGSRSKQVWISEGITVYYEYLVVKRAGITKLEETLSSLRENIRAYEYGSGHRFQSLVGASLDTWAEGANNQSTTGVQRNDDFINKTISYYDKGPVVGLMFDFAIRHYSQNKKSLDDVMRFLYKEYYQKRRRGFTEAEFQRACETAAGTSLGELFLYVSTVKDPDYKKYFNFGGLDIDTVSRELPGLYMGINLNTRSRGDTLRIRSADLGSPAEAAGLHGGMSILEVNGVKATMESLKAATADKKPGETIDVTVLGPDGKKTVPVKLIKSSLPSYDITVLPNPDPLQKAILESWQRVTVN